MNYESIRFQAFPLIVFMLFHEFDKSPAAEQAEQFSNFMDRGFALAVKNNFISHFRCDSIVEAIVTSVEEEKFTPNAT